MQPLSLLWHQSAGVAALVSKVYTAQLSDTNDDFFPSVQGVLVADEVGLGKTALVMGFQDFLMGDHWVTAENAPSSMDTSNFKRAPILADRPYFAGKRQIPNLPHVIVVPNSLTGQWSSEIVTFHSPQAIEVYHFPTAEKDWLAFWEGDWAKSKVPLINRVVIVPHSVFTTAGRCWDLRKSKKGGNLGKALDEKRHIKSPELEGACIWAHQKFLTCVVDEAHEFRNLNGAFYAVLETARAACFPLLLTATPLYTGPRDLHNLGRLARIAAFCGDQGDEREHACWKQLRTVRRSVTAVDRDASAEYRLKSIAGEEAELPAMPTVKALAKVLHEWIDEIRLGFGDRVIRRTVASKRFDGRRINDSLPESVMIVCPVRFDERTRVIIQDIMDRILSDRSVEGMDDGSKFNKKFYMEGRTKVAFPCFTSPLYAPVKTMEEYREKPSPKLELTIAILYHHLSKDDSVAIHFHAHPDDPAWPLLCTNVPNEKSDTKVSCLTVWDPLCALVPCHVTDKGARKVLIYHEFPMMAPLIESIMKLFHIDILMLNGTQTPEERNAIVHKFNADAQSRVLLFSAVGAVGLNLTVASIVILFDQCWSRMLVNQIIGRAWRLGQTDTVLVYNLVAMGTVDTLMIDHGETKGDMLNTFLAQGGRTITDALRRAADGRMADGDDLDDDDAKLMSDGGPSLSQNKRVKKTGEGGKKATAPVGKVATVIESGGATSRGRSRGSSEQREVAHVSEKASWTEPSKAPDFLQHTNEGEGGVEPVARCGPTPDFVNAHHPLTPEAARPASVPHGEPSSPTSPPTGMQQSSPPLPRVISALHSRPQITKPSVPTTVDVVSTPPLKRTYSSAHSPPVSPPTLHSPPRKKVHVQGSSNPSSGTLVVGGHVLRRSTSTVPVSAPRGRGRQGARGWYGRSN